MQNNNESEQNKKIVFAGLLVSVIKIFIVLVITFTFIFYIVEPPDTHSFFTQNTQSDTITRTVEPA